MKLSLACRRLQHALLHNPSPTSRAYWYRPGRLDVAALRAADREHTRSLLAQAEARGDAGLLGETTHPIPVTKRFSLRQWFRTIGEAVAASLHLAR